MCVLKRLQKVCWCAPKAYAPGRVFPLAPLLHHWLLPVYPLLDRGNPAKCLAQLHKDTTSELPVYLHSIPLMLNIKQGSCEYQRLKYFSLTRSGNRTQVYRLLTQK